MKNWNSRFEASERWLHTIKGHWTLAAWTFHISIQGVILWTLNWPLSSVKPILGKINLKNPNVFICFWKFEEFPSFQGFKGQSTVEYPQNCHDPQICPLDTGTGNFTLDFAFPHVIFLGNHLLHKCWSCQTFVSL